MPRAFADIAFTESVKIAQQRYGSREHNKRFEQSPDQRNRLSELDAEFISSRDSFYQASVGENGWPYVQHRGGAKGFLKVLDERTLGYADYRGNRQYISVGNINANDRVCLFLMDYAGRHRLKIWARAQVIHANENAELYERLIDAESKSLVERVILIHVEALEWNCSKHITPRFTQDEIRIAVQPLVDEIEQLKARLAHYETNT